MKTITLNIDPDYFNAFKEVAKDLNVEYKKLDGDSIEIYNVTDTQIFLIGMKTTLKQLKTL